MAACTAAPPDLELVFLMVILKIPIVYLCSVVWYAIKAKPSRARARLSPPGSGLTISARPRRRTHRFRPGPHGGPSRSYPRRPRTAAARAPH